jgi:integrase/recombinase XerD
MLTIYRRHKQSCAHRTEGRRYRRCRCPIWVDGSHQGKEIRKALGELDWEKAQNSVREWEATAIEPNAPEAFVSIAEATEKFLADTEARQLNGATIYKYKLLFRELKEFSARRGIKYLNDLEVDALGTFRSEWKLGPRSSLKKLERLRAFFGFAQRRKWLADNPGRELKAPKVSLCPTMPFTHEEMVRVLAALDAYAATAGTRNAQRLRAFVLLLRYSGMRIGDAVACSFDRVSGNKLFLYTQKTGTPVHCVLPDFVLRALACSPRSSGRYYFWTGASTRHSVAGKWQRRLQRLFALAKVPGGHAHRFRDTFAVELLLAGVPLERVSVLLGHSSIRVTERHYAPWTRSRQDQLEADLAKAWSMDPVALLETKGTSGVRGESVKIN